MEQEKTFHPNELPMAKFALIGITAETLASMPDALRKPLLSGHITPLFRAAIKTADGSVRTMPLRAQIVRNENNQLQVMTYPMRREIANELGLSPRELDMVKQGGILRKELETANGNKMAFVQLDRATNSLMYRSAASIQLEEQLRSQEKVKDIELGSNQKQAILTGKSVELEVGDTKVTVGVDLRQPEGFKVVRGDMQEWERLQKIRYDNAHEEFMGYVQTDENRWEYRKVAERNNPKLSEKRSEEKRQGMSM